MGWFEGRFFQGLVEGTAESVQAAIEKEQKDMDDLFKTQFSVRLNRRLDDVKKDGEALAEASNLLNMYKGYTGGDLDKASQVYTVGAGYGHENFLKKLSAIKLDGGKPLQGVEWAAKNNLPVGSTLDEYARSLVAPPTIAPIAPLTMGGGFLDKLGGMFGRDAAYSSQAQQSADRLSKNLQAMAPVREASQYTVATPTIKEGVRFETSSEKTTRETGEHLLKASKAKLTHDEAMWPHAITSAKFNALSAQTTAEIDRKTKMDRIAFIQDETRLKNAQLKTAELKLLNVGTWGAEEAEVNMKIARATLKSYTQPKDLEDSIGAVTWQLYNIDQELEEIDPDWRVTGAERQKLENNRERLINFRGEILAQKMAVDASKGVSSPLKNLSSVNAQYAHMMGDAFSINKFKAHIEGHFSQKEQRVVYMTKPSLMKPENKELFDAYKDTKLKVQKKFLKIFSGYDKDIPGSGVIQKNGRWQINYVNEAAKIGVEARTTATMRSNYFDREYYAKIKISPAEYVKSMMLKNQTKKDVIKGLLNIFKRTPLEPAMREQKDLLERQYDPDA